MIRGIYHEDEEDPAWRRVPTFATKVRAMMWSGAVQCALGCVLTTCVAQEEAEAFTKKNISNTCTNPKYSQCCHVFTTLCDWDQVQSLLLPKLEEYRRKFPVRPPSPIDVERNVFAKHQGVVDNVLLRADLPFHKRTTEESTLNTLRYCFFHMRCGIFVMIRRRKVVMFVPFVNHHYRNTWSKFLTIDHGNTLDSYYGVKQRSGAQQWLPVYARYRDAGSMFLYRAGKIAPKTSSLTLPRGGPTETSFATLSPTIFGATCF